MTHEIDFPTDNMTEWPLFKSQYDSVVPHYQRLAGGVSSALKFLIAENGISTLEISQRIKAAESAFEKITRKSYTEPFEQIEDWCGVRIICYYPSDVEKIAEIIRNEFNVKTEENTQSRLAPQEFGYRSIHLVVTMKDSWLTFPGYRKLNDLKVEIQVRTILMHAWAEIQHKLAYKSPDQVPDEFRRRLFRLSAKFEEADEQFEELREGLGRYREDVKSYAKDKFDSMGKQSLNLDTLAALLDAAYPDYKSDEQNTAKLLTDISNVGLTMKDLVDAIKAQRPHISKIEEIRSAKWAQVGVMRNALDIFNDKYYAYRKKKMSVFPDWKKQVELGRSLLGDNLLK